MITYKYPTNVALDIVTQEYIAQTEKFVGEKLMPFEDTQTQRVQWDELDSERGMTAAHTMGTDPKIDTRPGSKLREFTPIPFKETDLVKENELLNARAYGTLGGVVNITDLISRIAKARVDKNRIRVEWTRWQAMLGQLNIAENGVTVSESFAVQTHDAAVAFGTVATAAPLKEFNAVKLKFRGKGASANGAVAYLNQTTMNKILENQNANDLKGFQNSNFVHLPYSAEEVNKILSARGLPTLAVYDEGYIDDNGNFQTFIPDDKIVVVGKRPADQPIGKWLMTPTLHRVKNGMPAPGMFEIIEVNGMPSTGSTTVNLQQLGNHKNPKIEVTGGVYGGPVLFYPRSIIVMDVSSKEVLMTQANNEAGGAATGSGANAGSGNTQAPPTTPKAPPADKPKPAEKPKRVRVLVEGTLGPKLLTKGDVTDDPDYVAILEVKGQKKVEEVK